MFVIHAKNDLTIFEIEVNLSSKGGGTLPIIELYLANDDTESLKSITDVPSAWNLIGSCAVSPNGSDRPTVLPYGDCFAPFRLEAGTSRGVYITVREGGSLHYMVGDHSRSVYTEDDNLEIEQGYSITYPFGQRYNPRRWSGSLSYYLTSELYSSEFNGDWLSTGIAFDIYSRSADISVYELKTYISNDNSNPLILVYVKRGSHLSNSEDWTEVNYSVEYTDDTAYITFIDEIHISKETLISIYIKGAESTTDNQLLKNTRDETKDVNSLAVNDGFLSIFVGSSAYNGTFTDTSLIWNGSVLYSLTGFDLPTTSPATTSPSMVLSSPPSQRFTSELSTGFEGGNMNEGCAFTIFAENRIVLIGMDIHLIGNPNHASSVEIWYKEGSVNTDIATWDLIYTNPDLVAGGEGTGTRLTFESPYLIESGSGSFYVTIDPAYTAEPAYSRIAYSNGPDHNLAVGDLHVENEDLKIYVGSGFSYPLTDEIEGRIFNGVIRYSTVLLPSTIPSVEPSLKHSSEPSSAPSLSPSDIHEFGWRLWIYTNVETVWNVKSVQFYESKSCRGEPIDGTLGMAISSIPNSDPQDAFDYSQSQNDNWIGWEGSSEQSQQIYIGLVVFL